MVYSKTIDYYTADDTHDYLLNQNAVGNYEKKIGPKLRLINTSDYL